MISFKSLCGVGLVLSAVAAGARVQTGGPIRVVVDGDTVDFPNQQPIRVHGRVMVPLRGVFERLGAEVDWDWSTQSVTAYRHGSEVKLAIGRRRAMVNGQRTELDSPALIIGGSTMVPLRFVAESLGVRVSWDEADLEADISQAGGSRILVTERPLPPVTVSSVRSQPPVDGNLHRIASSTVIPWQLNARLSSNSANQGDPFTATLVTDGDHSYMGLPGGTVLAGTVGFVQTFQGDRPGVLELRFDRMMTPDGEVIPVSGRLVNLDNKGIVKNRDGMYLASADRRNTRTVFVGTGSGPGMIVGLVADMPIEDAAVAGLVVRSRATWQGRQSGEVVLSSGTTFGLRLDRSLTYR